MSICLSTQLVQSSILASVRPRDPVNIIWRQLRLWEQWPIFWGFCCAHWISRWSLVCCQTMHQLSKCTCIVTFVIHFDERFSLRALLLIPVQPEHQHLIKQTASADCHKHQRVLYWFRHHKKVDDFYNSRETQRGQDKSREEPPQSLNPAAGVGQTTAERWRSGGLIWGRPVTSGLGVGERFDGCWGGVWRGCRRVQRGEGRIYALRTKNHVYEDKECVEAIHQDNVRLAQMTDGDLTHQQQNGHPKLAPLLNPHTCNQSGESTHWNMSYMNLE